MAAAPFEKKATCPGGGPQGAEDKKTHVRVKKLTFWQKAVLTAGIIMLGGIPAALMALGSVPNRPPQPFSQSKASVISNTAPILPEASTNKPQKDYFRPAMNLQSRGKDE